MTCIETRVNNTKCLKKEGTLVIVFISNHSEYPY